MADNRPDGSIIIDAELSTKGLKAGSDELKRAVKSLDTAVKTTTDGIKQSALGGADNMKQYAASVKDAETEIAKLEKEIARLEAKKGKIDLSGYDKGLAELDASTADMMSRAKTPEQKAIVEQIQMQQLDQLDAKYKKLLDEQSFYNSKISEASSRLATLKQYVSEAGAATQQAANTTTSADSNAAVVESRVSRIGAGIRRAASNIAGGMRKGFSSAASAAGRLAKTVGGALIRGIGKAAKSISNMKRQVTGMHGSILKMGFAMLGMRGIWGGIRQVMSAALSSNQQLQNQLTAIKGVFGQAFLPIITVLINGLSKVVALADRIYQIFSGMSLISKYNATQMSKTAGSAGTAAKKAKELKRQLAGFDELNVLSDNSSDTGGGGGGGGGADGLFKTPELSKEMQDFIKQFKELWEKGDFYGIGQLISSKIVAALQSINWDDIKKKAFKGGKSFAEILNGLFEYSDADGNTLMSSIGQTIGEGLNTLLSAVDGFAANLHWDSLGSELSHGISAAIKTIDWKLVFKTAMDLGTGFGDFINGLFSYKDKDGDNLAKNLATGLTNAVHAAFVFLISFIKTVDWQQIGTSIAQFIQSIDWVKLFNDLWVLLSEAIKGLLDLLIGFVEGMDWGKAVQDLFKIVSSLFTSMDWVGIAQKLSRLLGDLVGAILSIIAQTFIERIRLILNIGQILHDYFEEHIQDAKDSGGSVVDGILQGIKDALSGIWNWIKTNIFEPFIQGFNNAFGIHSPSTVMAERGKMLIEGLKNGLSGIWKKIKEKFTEMWTSLKSWFTEKKDSIKELGSKVIDNIKSGIGGVWSKLKEKFTAFWTSLKEWFTNKVESFKSLGSNMIAKIKTGIANIWSTIKEKFTTFWSSLKGWFDGKIESFKNLGSNMISKIKNGVGNIWSSIKEKFTTFWSNLKGWFDGKAESVKNLGKNIINGITKGIREKISEVKTAITNGLDSAISSAKSFLGIASPSKVFRDQVGKFISLGIGKGILSQIPQVIKDVQNVAGAIKDEFTNDSYGIKPIDVDSTIPALNRGLYDFSSAITDSFTSLIDKLQDIAHGVTFMTPAAARGLAPYSVNNNNNDGGKTAQALDEISDELISVIIQAVNNQTLALVDALERNRANGGGYNGAGGIDSFTDSVIEAINRRTVALGRTPLKI